MNPLHFYADGQEIFELAIHEPQQKAEVPELLVQELWRLQLFDRTEMKTSCGKLLQIVKTGRHNHDQGPDFKDASIILDGQALEGDIEIHNREIDWILHSHQEDPGYNKVILHVLLHPEVEFAPIVVKENGQTIPNFVLGPRLQKPIQKLLFDFRNHSQGPFPCHASWSDVPKDIKMTLVQKRATDRFNYRVQLQREKLQGKESRDEVLYRGILRGLGYSKNTETMLAMSEHLGVDDLRNCQDDLDRVALLFGSFGLFASPSKISRMKRSDAEAEVELRSRFEALDLSPKETKIHWVNHRLRPSNRPKKRVLQLAFLFSNNRLFEGDCYERIRLAIDKNSRSLNHLFYGREPEGQYEWSDSIFVKSKIGKERIATLIANFVLPWLFVVAETEGDFRLLQKIETVYQNLTDKNDSITRRFLAKPSKEISRLSGEGLRELYQNWCNEGKCMQCDAGKYLLGRGVQKTELDRVDCD